MAVAAMLSQACMCSGGHHMSAKSSARQHAREQAGTDCMPCLRSVGLEVLVGVQRCNGLVDVEQLAGGCQLADVRARLGGWWVGRASAGVNSGARARCRALVEKLKFIRISCSPPKHLASAVETV